MLSKCKGSGGGYGFRSQVDRRLAIVCNERGRMVMGGNVVASAPSAQATADHGRFLENVRSMKVSLGRKVIAMMQTTQPRHGRRP